MWPAACFATPTFVSAASRPRRTAATNKVLKPVLAIRPVDLYGILPYTQSMERVMASTAAGATMANERLEARVTPEQKELFKEAANLQGVTLTDFIVSSVHQAAVRALEARHVLELNRRDQKAFVKALL